MIPLVNQAMRFPDAIGIISGERSYRISELFDCSVRMASFLLNGRSDLQEDRVAFMVDPGFDYVKTQWGIWLAGGIATPLCISYPTASLKYIIEDAGAKIIVASPQYARQLAGLSDEYGIRLITIGEEADAAIIPLLELSSDRNAMILYTSGTTNMPKGVVSSHENIKAQVSTLCSAWAWRSQDHILCVLPLHHIHGIINVVSCALWSGAVCEFLPKFSEKDAFEQFRKGRINVFMAVPTIYYKLIAYWETLPAEEQVELTQRMKQFRLMVSGSAALPVRTMARWQEISGHTLLERYGMTEIGMAISNPYNGKRRPGYVGLPLPGVQVRLVDEQYNDAPPGEPGEILVKGKNVFSQYWNRQESTALAFTPDGWFKTGDIAVVESDYYRIIGRNSVDIIKSGGYKISALEIEEVLRDHEHISDCAVVGIEDEEWGELVAAALVLNGSDIDLASLKEWLLTRLANYKIPRKYLALKELPRNAMGKVTKKSVKELFALEQK